MRVGVAIALVLFSALVARGETFTVTATAVGGGSVDAASKTVTAGGVVSFTATADAGKELYAWFGAPSNCASRLESQIVISNVTANIDLTARFGTPYYVEDCAAAQDAAGYGTSEDTPFRTAAYAAQNAPEYAICHLKGTLEPTGTITLDRPVRLAGYGTDSTFLSGKSMAVNLRMLQLNHADAVFDHVKFIEFTSSYSSYQAKDCGAMVEVKQGLFSDIWVYQCALYQYNLRGIVANRGGHVVRLDVEGTTHTGGGSGACGLAFYQDGGYAYDCHFHDCQDALELGNTRIDGGIVDHCRIENNGVRDFTSQLVLCNGAGVYMLGGTLMNSLIRGNTAESSAAGVYMKGKAVLSNCTVVANITYVDEEGSMSQSGLYTADASPRISRCIFWRNGLETSTLPQYNVRAGTMSDCLSLANPRFEDEAAGDYRLKIGSPAIALGAGCEPYVPDHSSLRCGFGVATNDVPAGGTAVLTAMVEGAGGNAVTYAWYLDDAATPFATTATATLANLAAGYRKVKLAVTAGGTTVESTQEKAINVRPLVAYVSDAGSSTYPYDTEEKATASFTDAFCALWQGGNLTGDLHVAEGVYKMKGCHVLLNPMRIHGAGLGKSILDGQYKTVGNFRAFYLDHAGAFMENVAVSNVFFFYGANGGGGGAKLKAGTLRNCRFQACDLETTYQWPAAVWMSNGVVDGCDFVDCWLKHSCNMEASVLYTEGGLVTNSVIRNCNRTTSYHGDSAAVLGVNGGTVDACKIVGNGTADWSVPGTGLYLKKGTVRNTLVACNTNQNKWAGAYVKDGLLEHCTIAGNVTLSSDTDGRSGLTQAGGTVRNCIIYGNGPAGTTAGSVLLNAGTFVTNVIDLANAKAPDAIVADPLFNDTAALDYRIKLGSSALDKAADVGVDHDLDGNVRPLRNGPDIGAYEYVPGSSGFIASISIGQSAWPSGSSPEATAEVEGAPGEVTYAWYADGGETPISTAAKLVWAGAANGKHALRLIVTSGETSITNDVAEAFDVKPLVTYAGPNGTNEYPYDSADKAARTLNAAYLALWSDATTPVTLHVLEGTVPIVDTVTLARKISVVGAGVGKSVVDGQAKSDGSVSFRGFSVQHDDALLAGLCISNVCYNQGGSGTTDGCGVGLAMSAGTVRDCRITHCCAHTCYMSAAGAFVSGGTLADTEIDNCVMKWVYQCYANGVYQTGGTVSNCWIHSLAAACDYGGTGATVSGGLMTCCRISGNGTSGAAGLASGVSVTDAGILRNSLVYGNTNKTNCAGVYVKKGGRVEHCTICGNMSVGSSTANAGLEQTGGTVKNSIVYGNGANYKTLGSVLLTGGTFATNIVDVAVSGAVDCPAADPSFKNAATNDFRLKLGSPAIDAGSPLTDCDADIVGTARDETPDLGAYEYVSAGGPLACGITVAQSDYPLGGTPSAEAIAEGSDLTDLTYAWYVDGAAEPAATTKIFSWNAAPVGRHALRLVVKNAGGETAESVEPTAFDIHPFTVYVATNGASLYPYETWERAATNVADAMGALWSGATDEPRTVQVGEGAYPLTDTINIAYALELAGAGMDRTLFDGSALEKRTLSVSASAAVVRDCAVRCGSTGDKFAEAFASLTDGTIRRVRIADAKNEKTNYLKGLGLVMSGGTLEDSVVTNCVDYGRYQCGGTGVYLTGGTIRNSLIAGNRHIAGASYHWSLCAGTAVWMTGGALVGCRIVGNESYYGYPGVLAQGGVMTNCLVASNFGDEAREALYVGNGVNFGPTGTKAVPIVNCTVAGNVSGNGNTAANVTVGSICNSIFHGNSSGDLTKPDTLHPKNSCWSENTSTDNGNLVGADPRFRNPARGDWSLRRFSPCVDAGDWTFLGTTADAVKTSRDAAGRSRFAGRNVDMGCYENPLAGFLVILQ